MADTELDVRERAPAVAAEPSQPTQRVDRVTVIKPAPRWPHLDLRELWQYRELLGRLAWRDVAVRYKQTSIGVAWAILQPLPDDGRLHVRLRAFANFPSNGVPYPIFTYSGLLPWTYFASAVALASASLVANRGLVTKVYFPRILLPLPGSRSRSSTSCWPRRARRDDGLVRRLAEPGRVVLAPLFLAHGLRRRARRRALPLGGQRALSRRSVRDSRSCSRSGSISRVSCTRSTRFRSGGNGCSRSIR